MALITNFGASIQPNLLPKPLHHFEFDLNEMKFSFGDQEKYDGNLSSYTNSLYAKSIIRKPSTFFMDSNIFLMNSSDRIFEVGLSGDVNKILESIKKVGGFLIIDFAYKELVYEDKLPSYFSWSPNENFISLRSNSKWCRGLGRRLGWIEAPKFVINAMESIQSSTILCPDTLHQMALTKFINDSIEDNTLTDYILETKKMYKHAAKKTVELIKQNLEFKIIEPDGGLYIFMKVDTDGQEFVQEMLKKTGVLFIPGWGFGNTGKNAVRVSFGPLVNNISKIEEGIIKISKILKQNN